MRLCCGNGAVNESLSRIADWAEVQSPALAGWLLGAMLQVPGEPSPAVAWLSLAGKYNELQELAT